MQVLVKPALCSSKWVVLLALSCGAVSAPAWAQTQSGEEAPTVMSLSKELICPCPSCGGKALDQCEPNCRDGQERRDAIAAQLKLGKNREQVVQFMSATYGAAILGEPPREGWGILSLAIPLACMAGGALPLLWFTRRRGARLKRPSTRRSHPVAPAEDARVAEALKDFDF